MCIGKDASGRWVLCSVTCASRARAKEEDRRLLVEAERDRTQFVTPTTGTLGAFLTEWLRREATRLRPMTRERYGRIARLHIVPALGSIRLTANTAGCSGARCPESLHIWERG